MMHYTTLKTLKQGGFDIIVDKTWEELSLKDCFDEEFDDLKEMQQDIDSGEFDWFMLRVRVLIDGKRNGQCQLGWLPVPGRDGSIWRRYC